MLNQTGPNNPRRIYLLTSLAIRPYKRHKSLVKLELQLKEKDTKNATLEARTWVRGNWQTPKSGRVVMLLH